MKTSGQAGGFCLFHMCVIGNMILAIAEIALAPGTIPEFQLRIGAIRATADGATMGVGGFGLLIHRNGTGGGALLLELNFRPSFHGYQIQYVFAKEQEVVGNGHQRE